MPLPGSVRIDRRILQWLVRMLAVCMALGVSGVAMAQPNPQYVLGVVIRGLQTGALNQTWFGQEVLQRIHQQTNGTFVYQNLVQLGAVQRIVVVGEQPMNNGTIYNMKATHARGETEWQMGISRVSNRIEYLAVTVVGSQPPAPAPPPSTPPSRTTPRTVDVEPEPQIKPLPYPQSPPPYGPGPTDPPGIEPAPPTPPSPPPLRPPAMPTPSPAPPGGGTGGSDACKLYPNLC